MTRPASSDLGEAVATLSPRHDGLERAAAHLAACGACTVTVQVAGGAHTGKAQVGSWTLPETSAPRGKLHLLGGWDETFTTRTP